MNGKKSVTIAIIAFCLVVAICVTLVTCSDDSRKIPDMKGRTTRIKYGDTGCGAVYEIELNLYFEEVKEKQKTWAGFGAPGLTCEKCGNDRPLSDLPARKR